MSNQQVTSIRCGRRRPSFQLHHRLQLAMDEHGVRPAEMAEHLKVSTGTISNYVNKHTRPNHSTIARWADKCEVDIDWLLYGDGTTGPGTGSEVVNDPTYWYAPHAVAA